MSSTVPVKFFLCSEKVPNNGGLQTVLFILLSTWIIRKANESVEIWYPKKDVTKHLLHSSVPSNNGQWELLTTEISKLSEHDSYQEALKRLNRFSKTGRNPQSASTDDADLGRGHRLKKRKTFHGEASDAEDFVSSQPPVIPTRPPPPKQPCQKPDVPSYVESSSDKSSSEEEEPQHKIQQVNTLESEISEDESSNQEEAQRILPLSSPSPPLSGRSSPTFSSFIRDLSTPNLSTQLQRNVHSADEGSRNRDLVHPGAFSADEARTRQFRLTNYLPMYSPSHRNERAPESTAASVTLNPRRSSASEHRNQEHDFPAASGSGTSRPETNWHQHQPNRSSCSSEHLNQEHDFPAASGSRTPGSDTHQQLQRSSTSRNFAATSRPETSRHQRQPNRSSCSSEHLNQEHNFPAASGSRTPGSDTHQQLQRSSTSRNFAATSRPETNRDQHQPNRSSCSSQHLNPGQDEFPAASGSRTSRSDNHQQHQRATGKTKSDVIIESLNELKTSVAALVRRDQEEMEAMGEVWDFPKLKERNELEEFEQRIREKDEQLKNDIIKTIVMEGEKRNKCIVSRAWAAIVDDSLGRDMNWFGRKDGRRTKQNLEPKIAICKLRLSCIVHAAVDKIGRKRMSNAHFEELTAAHFKNANARYIKQLAQRS